MQKLYRLVPLMNASGALLFLLILSIVPATTSLGWHFHWQMSDILMTVVLVGITVVTALAHRRQAQLIGLAINIGLIGVMIFVLWWANLAALVGDYLWLWSLLMSFNAALIGWGWVHLRNGD
ncbi:hypothetical protein FD13_GL000058 [Levilactobacillus senmaizukei DSM 21775 = NBRC 103853]|uniref:Integral membrane protein n=1 Tax=Levilactobacillus senmaizukei DSM 21775 = NBRC 103853 TaxID=1423803 RepID=A0A0R2DT39_9LACO|nr:hypothetical protein [Levilactobacillus senmaizukei]KRN03277.1 hypothetical protein FD13_GL000058 [Levilactobacillus senmaizukei DSM 21775 = NBRC 103853]